MCTPHTTTTLCCISCLWYFPCMHACVARSHVSLTQPAFSVFRRDLTQGVTWRKRTMLRCGRQSLALRRLVGILDPTVRWGLRHISSRATATASNDLFGCSADGATSKVSEKHRRKVEDASVAGRSHAATSCFGFLTFLCVLSRSCYRQGW